MNFVPHPVISGFTSAGGLIIAMSQLKVVCMPYMYALYVCLMCMPYMYALYHHRHVAAQGCVYALHVCLICMPYMYAL